MKKFNPIKNLKHYAHPAKPKSAKVGDTVKTVKTVKSVVKKIKKSYTQRAVNRTFRWMTWSPPSLIRYAAIIRCRHYRTNSG
jgi:hypothetical protein